MTRLTFGLGMLQGPEVVVDPLLGTSYRQVRFPRSKRKRLRKKWRANPANWSWVCDGPVMYEIGRPTQTGDDCAERLQALSEGKALPPRERAHVFGRLGLSLPNPPWLLIVNPQAKAQLDAALRAMADKATRSMEASVMRSVLGGRP